MTLVLLFPTAAAAPTDPTTTFTIRLKVSSNAIVLGASQPVLTLRLAEPIISLRTATVTPVRLRQL